MTRHGVLSLNKLEIASALYWPREITIGRVNWNASADQVIGCRSGRPFLLRCAVHSWNPSVSLSAGGFQFFSGLNEPTIYPPLSLSRRFQERRHLPQLVPKTRWHMVHSFRERAERAERLARSINDQQTCDALLHYARECREKSA